MSILRIEKIPPGETMHYCTQTKTINGTKMALILMKYRGKPKLLLLKPWNPRDENEPMDTWSGKLKICCKMTAYRRMQEIRIENRKGRIISAIIKEQNEVEKAVTTVNQGNPACIQFDNQSLRSEKRYQLIREEVINGIKSARDLVQQQ